ncbi:SDR family oxidoreductase [Deinococcus sp. KNUC1210]|uniref:SDR family oxidoreductase n=1 Tax=Deinococcus sp. KNUC1210 TaxID=2917691 RepID=UPI001EEF8FFF|nr:SDR family oxidoreductase [Deinococcus sp. KNUC1210]ULH15933.1 SDR family oxidoreductase [Deinococcus sp. KNUC1210]
MTQDSGQARQTVAVLGAGGGVGRQVVHQLVQAGDTVRALVRQQEQADALDALGAVSVLGDLSGDWEAVLDGATAVIWAAGAGTSGQFQQIDGEALMRVADRLSAGGPRRLIVVSSMGVDRPEQMPPFLNAVLRVKAVSDAHVQASGLEFTIVRPGGLTNETGTGQVAVGLPAPRGMISREDVAAVVIACLRDSRSIGKTFEVVGGTEAIQEALERVE